MEFKVGDVVYLKSNPERLMTVSIVFGATSYSGFKSFLERQYRKMGFVDGDVQCVWFDGNKFIVSFFKANLLNLKSRNAAHSVFKKGDRVFLKSNPEMLMTVTLIVGKPEFNTFLTRRFERKARKLGYVDGDVQCKWSNGLRYKIGLISAAMLEKKS